MDQTDTRNPDAPAGERMGTTARLRPLGATSVTIYATLLCLALAIPGSVVGALRDASPNPVTTRLLALATAIETGLDGTGLPPLYRAARERFRQISCGAPDSANPC